MGNLSNDARREQKRAAILANAKIVFQRNGFLDVTMKDIIEATDISRGGIYLYFKSVDEIFVAVLNQRNNHSLADVQKAIDDGVDFETLLQNYFSEQKDRLLYRMDNSLLRAAYEYYFTHSAPADRAFQKKQFDMTKETILRILKLGVSEGRLEEDHLNQVAEHIMFVIEGLSVLDLTGGLTKSQVGQQFEMLDKFLPRSSSTPKLDQ